MSAFCQTNADQFKIECFDFLASHCQVYTRSAGCRAEISMFGSEQTAEVQREFIDTVKQFMADSAARSNHQS